MKNTSKLFILLLGMLVIPALVEAQEKVQVVTKLIENTFAYQKDNRLVINGEKADITINTWEKPEVAVQIKLISKHASKEKAEKELQAMKYVLEKTKGVIYVRNYILIPENSKVESILKAEFQITVPATINTRISDSFGKIKMNDANGTFHIGSKYCDLIFNNLKGNINLTSYFGDIALNGTEGNLKIKSDYSKIESENLEGNLKAELYNSDIKLKQPVLEGNNEITGQNASIVIAGIATASYDLDFTCADGDIKLSQTTKEKVVGNSKKTFKNKNGTAKAALSINNIIGNIVIE
jgi:hypothetical protein